MNILEKMQQGSTKGASRKWALECKLDQMHSKEVAILDKTIIST